jgi:ornithine--oxo-acid transaminase
MSLAKGLGSGVPIGACLAAGKAAGVFKPGNHGSTFGGNPLACKVAMTALQVLKDEQMAENAAVLGELLRNELRNLQSSHISLVRGKGLLNAIVIKHENKDAAWELCLQLKNMGLLAKPTHGDKIRFAPPLVITKEQILDCVKIISNSLAVLD